MRKRDELTNPASCMARAGDDEMTFILLGRDKAAPDAIRYWIKRRIELGKNHPDDPQIVGAEECARVMESERGLDAPAAPVPEPPAESEARRIASAIHARTVGGGMPLDRALKEVKEEFEGGPEAPKEQP